VGRMRGTVLVLALLLSGCAPTGTSSHPGPRTDTQRQEPETPAMSSRITPTQRTTSTPAPAPPARPSGDPVAPAQVTIEPEQPAEASDGRPAWWLEQPVRDGARVRVTATADGETLQEARAAAVIAGYQQLRRALGQEPRDAETLQVYPVNTGGGRFRVYVMIVGE
jgi:hypothetical protein